MKEFREWYGWLDKGDREDFWLGAVLGVVLLGMAVLCVCAGGFGWIASGVMLALAGMFAYVGWLMCDASVLRNKNAESMREIRASFARIEVMHIDWYRKWKREE